MNAIQINIPAVLGGLYAHTDAERFPAAQLGEGLERESTLFWADFKVALPFGMKAVKETFEMADYKNRGYKAITELAVVMNHLCWEYYAKFEEAAKQGLNALAEKWRTFSQYFTDRYYEICEWVDENFKPEEAQFFWAIMD